MVGMRKIDGSRRTISAVYKLCVPKLSAPARDIAIVVSESEIGSIIQSGVGLTDKMLRSGPQISQEFPRSRRAGPAPEPRQHKLVRYIGVAQREAA